MSTPMKPVPSQGAHREFNDAMKAVIAQFNDRLDAMQMLAVASHLVGVLVALQDQSKVTREMALDLIMANIEAGNAEAVKDLTLTVGNG